MLDELDRIDHSAGTFEARCLFAGSLSQSLCLSLTISPLSLWRPRTVFHKIFPRTIQVRNVNKRAVMLISEPGGIRQLYLV